MPSSSSSNQTNQRRNGTDLVTLENFKNFIFLLNDQGISLLMDQDRCYLTTDKYMLAYSLVLLARAGWLAHDLSPRKFYAALYLAHEMEEDIEDGRWELIPWAYPMLSIEEGHLQLQKLRLELFEKISFKALVSKIACEEVIKISSLERIWKRDRKAHHAGALRIFNVDEVYQPVGPYGRLKPCSECRSLFIPTSSDAISSEIQTQNVIEISSSTSSAKSCSESSSSTSSAESFSESSCSTLAENRDYSINNAYGFLKIIRPVYQQKTLLIESSNPRVTTRTKKINLQIKSTLKENQTQNGIEISSSTSSNLENQTQNVAVSRVYSRKRAMPFNDSTFEFNIMDVRSSNRSFKKVFIESWVKDVSTRVFNP